MFGNQPTRGEERPSFVMFHWRLGGRSKCKDQCSFGRYFPADAGEISPRFSPFFLSTQGPARLLGASRLIQTVNIGGEVRPPPTYYSHDQRTSGFYTGASNKVRRLHTKPCHDPYRFRPVHAKLLSPRPPVIQPAPQNGERAVR